jgi:hypothetical protein
VSEVSPGHLFKFQRLLKKFFIGPQPTNFMVLPFNNINCLFFKAPSDFTATKARSEVISFSTPITMFYHSVFIKNPVDSYNIIAYIEPFRPLSWFGLFWFILISSVFLYTSSRYIYVHIRTNTSISVHSRQ